jgi:hypothetical protein
VPHERRRRNAPTRDRTMAGRPRSILVLVVDDHLDDLRAQARYARERYELYKARTFGQRPTSLARLQELELAAEQATARLRFAESEAQRARDDDEQPRESS